MSELYGGRWVVGEPWKVGQIYYFRVRDTRTGRVYKRSSRQSSKRRGKQVILDWISELENAERAPRLSRMPFSEAYREFLDLKRPLLRDSTLRDYLHS